MNDIKNYLYMFLVSLVPVAELRVAIPMGAAFGIPWWAALPICIAGNMLPLPFIMLFIRKIINWMKDVKYLCKFADWLEKKVRKNEKKIAKYESLGLFFFVALPLPGTGGWTGALMAAMLDIRMKYALPSILAGIVAAGLIVTGIAYGSLHFLSFLI